MVQTIHPDAIKALINGEMGAPKSILGRHQSKDGVSIRTMRPWADTIQIINDETKEKITMEKVDDAGLFIASVDLSWAKVPYHYEAKTFEKIKESFDDPYVFARSGRAHV